ncbi:MAG: hypothetical protein AAGI53_01730 [Planctomycetota bacterium]
MSDVYSERTRLLERGVEELAGVPYGAVDDADAAEGSLDCYGFARALVSRIGVDLPERPAELLKSDLLVDLPDGVVLRPGDILSDGPNRAVGVVIDSGRVAFVVSVPNGRALKIQKLDLVFKAGIFTVRARPRSLRVAAC